MPAFFSNTSFSSSFPEILPSLVLYFVLFAVVGWVVEMLYLSTARRGLINSGFLQGPVCPAYAAGALLIYPFTLLLAPLPFWIQCLAYAGLATVVEYLAHFALERILGIRVWDYSDEFMNFQGRISLKYTVFWFFLVLFLVLVLQPGAITLIELLPFGVRLAAAVVSVLVLGADYALSAWLFSRMTRRIRETCQAFALPFTEMQELQFNRPRIMNEKKRLAKLSEDPAFARTDREISARLFEASEPGPFGFDPSGYGDIVEAPAYKAWRSSSAQAEGIYRRYLRIAELAWAFCRQAGLDAEAAARGILLAAYWSVFPTRLERATAYLLPQRRVLRRIAADLGPVGRVERDVILRYKWPLNFGPPRTTECLLASFAEKLVQSREARPRLASLYEGKTAP